MFNRTIIKTCFEGLIGWRNSDSTCIPTIDSYNTTSKTGVYVDALPGVSLKRIYACLGKDYSPDATGLNKYLKNLYEDSTQELIRKYAALQSRKTNGKNILSNQELGYNAKDVRRYVTPHDRFVLIEFKPFETKDYLIQLLYFGLWLKQSQTLTIYVYSSQQITPIKTFDAVYNTPGSLQKFSFALDDKMLEAGGAYYVGYYESDLTGGNQAIDTLAPCGTCSVSSSELKKYAPYIRVRTGNVASGDTFIDKGLFSTEKISYNNQSYGMTASINVTCDLSFAFCDNVDDFGAALQKMIAINALWMCYNSKELGPDAELSKDDTRLMADKYAQELTEELNKIVIDFTDTFCKCIGSKRGSLQRMGL